MHSRKDVEKRSVFLINGTQHQVFKVRSGFLFIWDSKTQKAITKLPFPKMLCILVIGHTKITTSFIEHANKHGVPIVVMKPNFRTVYSYGNLSDANYLLRAKQHKFDKHDLSIAKHLVINKIENCRKLLQKTKRKSEAIDKFYNAFQPCLDYINQCDGLRKLMAAEGRMASYYFAAYFEKYDWHMRVPKAKPDYLNCLLDIGYTFLFNYIEANARMFGFDLYVGVLHQLWFQRKSLVCDLQEPFRCIIDWSVYNALQRGEVDRDDFRCFKGSYYLKPEAKSKVSRIFFESIVKFKMEIYIYIQQYYRSFMKGAPIEQYPKFSLEHE